MEQHLERHGPAIVVAPLATRQRGVVTGQAVAVGARLPVSFASGRCFPVALVNSKQ
jgi:hypothetical protein